MTKDGTPLKQVYDGWDGYQTSLVKAIEPLTVEQLLWRPAADRRSVGEVAAHIAFGRIQWFSRMDAPGSAELARAVVQAQSLVADLQAAVGRSAIDIIRWLNDSWHMVDETLTQWTVADLTESYLHSYQGKTYAVSRQWTIWRMLSHDIHHGGQLTMMLAAQGISPLELSELGGHLTEPPVVA
jgi:uncharacterized damage-inducible protein DinB